MWWILLLFLLGIGFGQSPQGVVTSFGEPMVACALGTCLAPQGSQVFLVTGGRVYQGEEVGPGLFALPPLRGQAVVVAKEIRFDLTIEEEYLILSDRGRTANAGAPSFRGKKRKGKMKNVGGDLEREAQGRPKEA